MEYLVPIAIDRLEQDPLASGDFGKGDLLKAVLEIDLGYWENHRTLASRLYGVIVEVDSLLEAIRDSVLPAGDSFRKWLLEQGGDGAG